MPIPRTAPQPASHRAGTPLYEEVADRLASLIEAGTLRPGDRAPSVRALSRDQQVSITTAVEAYRVLESRALVEARPKSGFFVARRPTAPVPERTDTAARPRSPSTVELILRVRQQANDPRLVPFGAAIASPSFFPVQALHREHARALREEPDVCFSYDELAGSLALRRQVARRALHGGSVLAPDEIVTTSGAQQAMDLALRAVTKPGDVVAVESPTYFGLHEALAAQHLRALEIATDPVEGIDLDELERAFGAQRIAACALAPTCGNPLGHSMPEERRRQVVELCAERSVPLLEDDVYGDLLHDYVRPRTLQSFDREGAVLLCSSFSKTLTPGYRVGWLVPGRYRDEVLRLKNARGVSAAPSSQLAVARYLERGGYDRLLRKLRRTYRELLMRTSSAVAANFPAGTRVTRPAGGHVLWVEVPGSFDALTFFERALERGIGTAPGPIFSASGRFRNCLRLNAAVEWSERVDWALEELGRLAL
ncbi:MAG TPA: PLP-dependent aminotransferase family protein [Thermoanaerobaculia bacterium]|nr:PLP-dependent aminotransferase family protein [Thermoanaerobaculia bacterium]